MRSPIRLTLLATALLSLSACGDDGGGGGNAGNCTVVPGAWSAPAWTTNAATALNLRAQLDALVGANAMRGAEQGTVVIDNFSQLNALYEAGSPGLDDVTTPTYDAVVLDSFDGFVALIAAGEGDPIDGSGAWMPGPNGGIFGGSDRGINAGGLEVRQIVDKGLFGGGALYNYALGLTAGTITPATVDAVAAAWGTNDALNPAGMLTDSANYSYQMGFHAEIAAALTAAKAYAADANCSAERDDALIDFFRNWEQSLLARLVYYANVAANGVAGSDSDDDLIAALHELSEGTGLALGFKNVPNPTAGPLEGASVHISAADIDDIMAALGVASTDINASTTGLFVEDAEAFAAAVAEVEAIVADVYNLSESDLASYRTPVAG